MMTVQTKDGNSIKLKYGKAEFFEGLAFWGCPKEHWEKLWVFFCDDFIETVEHAIEKEIRKLAEFVEKVDEDTTENH
jgi:hypothetical protein